MEGQPSIGSGGGSRDESGNGSGNGFWGFSLALYERPAVAEACLALQDGFGADVNLLLLCLWRARRGFPGWSEGELARAEAAVAPVNAVLKPLREARRALQRLQADEPTAAALHAEAKVLELRIEQVAQAWLAAASHVSPAQKRPGPRDREADEIEAAAAHLADYLDRIAPNDPAALQAGAKLLRAAFA